MTTRPSANDAISWTRHRDAAGLLLCGATFRPAWRIALLVGALLTAINQGDVLLTGQATTVTWLRVAANVAVPYTVASCGFLSACRAPALPEPDIGPTGG